MRAEARHIRSEFDRGRAWQRINMAIARGAAAASLRRIDPTDPATWEFSGFSQNGEDGVIDYLLTSLKTQNRYFIEIGASNGLENNTSWLAIVRRYSGIMVEGDRLLSEQCAENFASLNWGLQVVHMRMARANARALADRSLYKDPDVLSLDIDGIDYYVAQELLGVGLRPKIFVVEYNSAFGPDAGLTVEYKQEFDISKEHPKRLYYGVSVGGWRRFFKHHDYQFVTVDQNGVNAFFVDQSEFTPDFLKGIRGTAFRENFAQRNHHRAPWQGQFKMLEGCRFIAIE